MAGAVAALAALAALLAPLPPSGPGPAALASGTKASGTAASAEDTLFMDYRDVPGVTQEEIDAVERLKRGRSFLVYGSCPTTEAFVAADGRIGGFSARMASWLSSMFGMDVQPRVFGWDELVEGMDSGQVDFTGELSPTPDRLREYLMTPPIAGRGVRFFRMEGAPALGEITRERRLRFAFLAGSVTPQTAAAAGGLPFDPIETADYQTAYILLSTGLADAFIDESPAEASFDRYGDVTASDFFPVISSQVSLSTKNPEAAAVVSVVSKAIAAGASRGIAALYARGQADYRHHKYTQLISPDEFRFLERRIASGDPILFAAESDNYPISFWNAEEGEFQGIALDVLREISAVTGMEFRAANEGPVEWPELLQMLEDGDASVITELIRSPEREGRYLWAEPPFSRDRYAMLSLASTPDKSPGEILYAEVGLVTETAWAEVFRSWFRNHPSTREYPDSDRAFAALERGEIELLMGTRSLNLGMTNYRERPGFKVNYVFESGFDSSFGLNIHETMVRSLVSKALPLIDCEAVTDRWLQRTFDYRGKLARSRVPWLAGFTLVLALLLTFTFTYMRRKTGESRRLEKELRESTAELASQREDAFRELKAKGDFLARMSHEIRTPMNAVIGMAELALREKIPDEAQEMISNILRAGNSLLTIINDILDFSKIESGRMELVTAPYRLEQLISDSVGIAAVRVAEKPVTFLVEADPRLPAMLTGDEVRIRQVMLNLLSNAAKYTRTGFVKLRVETGTYVSPERLCAWPRSPGDRSEPVLAGPPGDSCEWRPKSKDGEFCVWPPVDLPNPSDRGRFGTRVRDIFREAGTDAPGPGGTGDGPPSSPREGRTERVPGAASGADSASAGTSDAGGTGAAEGSGAGGTADAGEAPDGSADPTDPRRAGGDGDSCGRPGPDQPKRVALRIAVSDSGIGIRPEDMEKLFATFSQVDQHQNRGIEGTGLGLAITRNLAVLMGGTVTVESEYGKGSVFTAEIPQDVHCPYAPLAAVKDPQGSRVLFLEPDPLRGESLEWTMARLGASWETATDPASFKAILRDGSFAYVFAHEEDELLTSGLLQDAGCLAKTVYLTPVGVRPARIRGALSAPLPLWSLPISRILNDETDARPARERSDATLTAPTARALVVDDLPVNLKVARGLLGPFKVEVDTCESGAEAVRLCSEHPYDIIFMDHVMPGMDGIEATERIRSGPRGKQVPIIALTANAVSGMREMFMSHGMNGFISKPIEVAKLETALRDWLPGEKIVEHAPGDPPPANAPAEAPDSGSPGTRRRAPVLPGAGDAPGPSPRPPSRPSGSGRDPLGPPSPGDSPPGTPSSPSEAPPAPPEQAEPQVPGQAEPQAPEQAEPQVPGKAEPQAPEQAEPQVPGQAEPQAPEQASGSPDVGLSGSGPFRSPRNPPRFRDGGFDPEASLAQLAGDHELMEEVLEMYIQSTPALLDTLRGIDSANVADFAKTFHSLKGSSLNVGARKVGEMAASLEKAAKEGDSETVMATFADFIETAEGLIFQMTSYLKHISPER